MGKGKHTVWHKSGSEFVPVARVEAGDVLAAVVLTMNRTDAAWAANDRVTALLPNARSTDLGDVIVNPEGAAYQITAPPGGGVRLDPVDFAPHREQAAMFREWEADYAAARERDVEALFGDGPIRSPGPPEAATDNQISRGGRE